MKAVIMTGVGGPEVLQIVDLPAPAAGVNQILVRVKTAGVNPIDYKIRKSGAFGAGHGSVLGFDAAGIVEAIGPGVTAFKPGDKVFYSPDWSLPGAYAEFNAVDARLVARMPEHVTFEEAAAVPLAGMTAWDGLFTRGELSIGQTLLIAAANGGVGTLAVQLAKAAGAYVFGTCSARSIEHVKSIPVCGPEGKSGKKGPDRVLNYQTEDWATAIRNECPGGLDLVYDCAGQDVVSRSIPLMKSMGRIVSIVNPTGKLDEGYRKNVSVHYEFLQRSGATLEKLAALMQRGQLVAMLDEVMPLERVAEAHRKLEAGGVAGKIVLRV